MSALPALAIVDQFGSPLRPKQSRQEVAAHFAAAYAQSQERQKRMAARYDAADETPEFTNYWANADQYDSDSANSRTVRQKLVSRSRYEVGNNGYASGITRSFATDTIGKGPKLRMQTQSEGFNRMVEREFTAWAKEIRLRRKLWCMAHAYDQDGEAFGVVRQNRRLRHRVKLNLVLHETEQCRSPYGDVPTETSIDGIDFDQDGNPIRYTFTRSHPGRTGLNAIEDYEPVDARFVCHWFLLERPGQHRGVPIGVSSMNTGAARRRWTEAVVAAAENIADFSVFLKTNLAPEDGDAPEPMSTFDIQKRMMVTLPDGYEPEIPKAEQPTANHAEFTKSLVSEQARPRGMPYNRAAADHSGDSFASGRLDHLPYYDGIDCVNREDCEDLVLDPLFDVWFDFAVREFNWLGGDPEALSGSQKLHGWDWPAHKVADEKSAATANKTKLSTGQTTLAELDKQAGSDYEDRLPKEAESNGITVDEQRTVNFLLNLPQHLAIPVGQALGMLETPEPTMPDTAAEPEQSEPVNVN